MTINEKIYTSLCILFSCFIMLGNLTYQKFVTLPMPLVYEFEISVGALLYPMTFLVTDLITEFYGKEKATFCVRFALCMNVLAAIMIALMNQLPATPWSRVDDATFHLVFGAFGIAFAASVIACYVSQAVDIYLYLWIRKLTQGRYLWLRSNGSTCVSLLIDTFTVIGIMTAFGVLPMEQMWSLIINSYTWKIFFTLSSTPLFYLAVQAIRWASSANA